jgi:8-oxo-dGTP pyrophosphatase MutT (NUDIX family)
MDFQVFLAAIPELLQTRLLGLKAHLEMAPLERIESLKNQNLKSRNPKAAAVLMLLYPKKNQTHLVLILRNSYEGVHSAQIALPGGKHEVGDLDLQNTALRETEEEIGIYQKKIEIIRAFTPLYIPVSNYLVQPFLGISREELHFVPNPSEVAQIIEVPLKDFLDDTRTITTTLAAGYLKNKEIPAFQIKEHMVWGATAMILNELKDMLIKVL